MSPWFQESYARILVDNHISEDSPDFMSKFDPRAYVDAIISTGCDASMVPACDINGNCYYPSKVGHMHQNLKGRDIFGQTVALLKQSGITPRAYYNVIWHNDAAKNNPQWRLRDAGGKFKAERYWFCCPNHPDYVEFSRAQIREVVSYDIAEIFIDMTFWPGICYCPVCRDRFLKECGLEMPTRIDWSDKNWMLLQRARERWLNEFAAALTEAARQQQPGISVIHQFSPVMLGWYLALDASFSLNCDYATGDFYGGKHQHRLGTKVMSAFSTNVPFEFMTSRCVNMYDHTSLKSDDELLGSAATILANGGAYLFIDAINPEGTLEKPVHAKLGQINARLRPYTNKIKETRPVLAGDVGLYFSMASHFEPGLNGTDLVEFVRTTSMVSNMETVCEIRSSIELLGASIVLNQLHQPYRIITERCEDLAPFKTIIINHAMVMSNAEADRLRDFVQNGGTLIVTGETSLYAPDGLREEFALADVMGVSYSGSRTGRVNYLLSAEDGYVVCDYPAPLVKATTAKVLAQVCEPFTDPDDYDHHASIHSNPPGPAGEFVALSENQWGKGTCVYLYSSLMALQNHAQQSFTAQLFNKYVQSDFKISTNAPACVEITILRSTVDNRLLICCTNLQDELSNIPIRDLTATLRLPADLTAAESRDNVGSAEVTVIENGQAVDVRIPQLETMVIVELELTQ